MTELTDKTYPTLPTIREAPTAPPVVNGGVDDRGHGYRLNNCYVHTQFYLALYMCVFILNSFPCGYF